MLAISLIVLIITLIIVFTTQPRAHADSWSWIDPDDNTAIMQEVANALADVELLFDTGPLHAYTGWIGTANTYAQAVGDGITVNKMWTTGTYQALTAQLNADIAAGYHNGGCTPVRGMALHEAAHVINNMRGKAPVRRAQAAVGYGPRPDLFAELSGYSFNADGSVDAGEAIAEAFQAVMCGVGGPVEHALYDMLVG